MNENKILKPAQVIMLPTNKPNTINQICKFSYGLNIATVADIGYPAYDLYFTTEDEIKEADWGITARKELYQAKDDNQGHPIYGDKKVVATTNPELWWKDINGTVKEMILPKIPLSFVQAFVEAQGKIDKVMLEYSPCLEFHHEENNYTCNHELQLKLRSDGSAIVHPVKERTYTREEIRNAVRGAFVTAKVEINDFFDSDEGFDDWFDKNYPE